MPFDAVSFHREPSPLLRLLHRARDRIKKSWVRNASIRQRCTAKGIRYSYCLLGSLSYDNEGLCFIDRKEVDLSSKAINLVADKVREKHGRASIPNFNDNYCTTKDMVIGVLDDVIDEQEQREVTPKVTAQ